MVEVDVEEVEKVPASALLDMERSLDGRSNWRVEHECQKHRQPVKCVSIAGFCFKEMEKVIIEMTSFVELMAE